MNQFRERLMWTGHHEGCEEHVIRCVNLKMRDVFKCYCLVFNVHVRLAPASSPGHASMLSK